MTSKAKKDSTTASTSTQEDPPGHSIQCEDCDDMIPFARLKLVNTKLCVVCQENYERELIEQGNPVRHRMAFEVVGSGDEVEEVNLHLVRAK